MLIKMSTLLYETEKNEPGKIMMPLRERKPEVGVVLGALDFKKRLFFQYIVLDINLLCAR